MTRQYIRRQTTPTTTPEATAPVELDLNFEQLKKEATSEFVSGMREALKVFDGLEALENLLHRRAAAKVKAMVEAQGNGNGNGNGHNGNGHTNGNGHRATPKMLAAADAEEPKKRKIISRRTDMEAAESAVSAHLKRHAKDGVTTKQAASLLASLKIIDSRMAENSQQSVARVVLTNLVNDGQARVDMPSHRERVSGAVATYYLKGPGSRTAAGAKAVNKKPAKPTQPPHTDAIMAVLVGLDEPVSPVEITEMLLARKHKFYGSNPPNNHVNWALRDLHRKHLVKVTKQANGKPLYTANRPTISVTKEE